MVTLPNFEEYRLNDLSLNTKIIRHKANVNIQNANPPFILIINNQNSETPIFSLNINALTLIFIA